jgi:hypothetical protein
VVQAMADVGFRRSVINDWIGEGRLLGDWDEFEYVEMLNRERVSQKLREYHKNKAAQSVDRPLGRKPNPPIRISRRCWVVSDPACGVKLSRCP